MRWRIDTGVPPTGARVVRSSQQVSRGRPYPAAMRVVVVGGLGAALGPPEVGAAITTGWHAAASDDELVVLPAADDGLGAALDGAGLGVAVAAEFDWQSLRDSLVTAVAGAAVERGVPCVVLAGQVSVGRREAGPSAWTPPTPSPMPPLLAVRRPSPPKPSPRWPNVSRVAGVVDPDRRGVRSESEPPGTCWESHDRPEHRPGRCRDACRRDTQRRGHGRRRAEGPRPAGAGGPRRHAPAHRGQARWLRGPEVQPVLRPRDPRWRPVPRVTTA